MKAPGIRGFILLLNQVFNTVDNFVHGNTKVLIQLFCRTGSAETVHADDIAMQTDIFFLAEFGSGLNGNTRRSSENFLLIVYRLFVKQFGAGHGNDSNLNSFFF